MYDVGEEPGDIDYTAVEDTGGGESYESAEPDDSGE